jgi:hypothetical protein
MLTVRSIIVVSIIATVQKSLVPANIQYPSIGKTGPSCTPAYIHDRFDDASQTSAESGRPYSLQGSISFDAVVLATATTAFNIGFGHA